MDHSELTSEEQSVVESWFETVYENETSWQANYRYIDEVRGNVGQFNKSLRIRLGYGLNLLDYVAQLVELKHLQSRYVAILSIPLRVESRIVRDSFVESQFTEIICERMSDSWVPAIMCSNTHYYVEYYEKRTLLTDHLVDLPTGSQYLKKVFYAEYHDVNEDEVYPSVYVVVDLRT